MDTGPIAALAVVLLLAACGAGSVGAGADDEQASSGSRPAPATHASSSLPSPRQLPPAGATGPLTDQQVDDLVAAALRDPPLRAAVAQGVVTQVLVRASLDASRPDLTAEVVFSFEQAVLPTQVPWEVLCDIGGQTPEWSGAVARVVVGSGSVESSPLWLTGANCVGVTVPEDPGPAARSSPLPGA